jgi:uncharacterized protein YjbI with pentapeptide repeats
LAIYLYLDSMTIQQLKHRWTTDWLAHANRLADLLKSGQTPGASWPLTQEGKVDLRGYTVSQEKYEYIPPHRKNPAVLQGPRLKKLKFINTDFSHSDWECTEFTKCHFENCQFDGARWRDIRFYGCTFANIHFKKTDFGEASFGTELSLFFRSRKLNFIDVTFEKCNFSNGYFYTQEFKRCSFHECKTGFLKIEDCRMQNIKFTGTVHNLFFTKNKMQQFDFTESFLRGVNFEDQTLDGFLLPEGDGYYIFKNETEEIAWLANQPLAGEERKVRDTMIAVWTFEGKTNNRFTDVHWLEADEIETGKRILQMLKNR